MNLPVFHEEHNHGVEKAFDQKSQAMINSLLYAKLPRISKSSVNMAGLNNGTNEEIVTHLEGALELNRLDEIYDIAVPTMPRPQQHHDRVVASSPQALTQDLRATIARNRNTKDD